MGLSYWEYKSWLSNIDFTIVGSGIVGLNCALELRERFPKAKILVLEKGTLPQGASTKNAGFACFGSISEILADLKKHSEEEVLQLVQQRWDGIQFLRKNLGDAQLDFQQHGGHELFLEQEKALYAHCYENLKAVNQLLKPVFKNNAFTITSNSYDFKGIHENIISHVFEGQIDTGSMMKNLLKFTTDAGITILNSVNVLQYSDIGNTVAINTANFEFTSKKLLIATNGFSSSWLKENIKPARAQVLITKPIKDLAIKGTFHIEEGYYYFRNIDDRVLLGGGRNLDFKAEETTELAHTSLVQNTLKDLLKNVILTHTDFEIDQSWSGIMGVGPQKKPVIKQVSDNVACGVRLGGMGVAIGSFVGKELATLF